MCTLACLSVDLSAYPNMHARSRTSVVSQVTMHACRRVPETYSVWCINHQVLIARQAVRWLEAVRDRCVYHHSSVWDEMLHACMACVSGVHASPPRARKAHGMHGAKLKRPTMEEE